MQDFDCHDFRCTKCLVVETPNPRFLRRTAFTKQGVPKQEPCEYGVLTCGVRKFILGTIEMGLNSPKVVLFSTDWVGKKTLSKNRVYTLSKSHSVCLKICAFCHMTKSVPYIPHRYLFQLESNHASSSDLRILRHNPANRLTLHTITQILCSWCHSINWNFIYGNTFWGTASFSESFVSVQFPGLSTFSVATTTEMSIKLYCSCPTKSENIRGLSCCAGRDKQEQYASLSDLTALLNKPVT